MREIAAPSIVYWQKKGKKEAYAAYVSFTKHKYSSILHQISKATLSKLFIYRVAGTCSDRKPYLVHPNM